MIDPELKAYVEREVLPRYDRHDAAHRRDHAAAVIEQSLAIARQLQEQGEDIDLNMAYAIAAYHDTGLCEGREHHHEASARIIRQDDELRRWFTPEQIEIMADAAEDHRASAPRPPRTIYGRIVAEADRVIDPETIIRRTVQYGMRNFPALSRDEQFGRTMQHLREKYGTGGYLRLQFPDSPNAHRLALLRRQIEDLPAIRATFDRICDALDKFDTLRTALERAADPTRAAAMSAYMRNQFTFFGIPTKIRRDLSGDLLRGDKRAGAIDWHLVDLCWADEHREMQYVACDYLAALRGQLGWNDAPRLQRLLTTKSWWDTVDGLDRLAGGIADERIAPLMRQWSLDDNMWLRRAAIDHQIGRKEKTDEALLEEIIANNLGSKEFFINKAIGWSLRDYARTNPEWVCNFVKRHHAAMASLSIREATKHL